MGKNKIGKGSHARWTDADNAAFLKVLATHDSAAGALAALRKHFEGRSVSGLRSRMEVLFNAKKMFRVGIPAEVYDLLLAECAKLKRARHAKKAHKTIVKAAQGPLFLPAAECAKVSGYSQSNVAHLARIGKIKRKKLDDGSYLYDADAARKLGAASPWAGVNKGVKGRKSNKKLAESTTSTATPTQYLPAQAAAAAAGCSTSFIWKAVKNKLVRMRGTSTHDRVYHVGDVRKARLSSRRRGKVLAEASGNDLLESTVKMAHEIHTAPTNGVAAFTEKLTQYRNWAEVSANVHMLSAERAAEIIDATDLLMALATGGDRL